MKIKNLTIAITSLLMAQTVYAQSPGTPSGGASPRVEKENWILNVVPMDKKVRESITDAMDKIEDESKNRNVGADIIKTVLGSGISGLVEVVVQETYNLAQYRNRQKQEWMRMIQNENNYTDSITSIKNIEDFYTNTSFKGALDPSDINFDGIEIKGMRDGEEMIYLKCSIDKSKLSNLFNHSKFNLVLDTIAFYPYRSHLPNVTANGIKTMKKMKKKKGNGNDTQPEKGDTIIRPGKGGNMFSFNERNDLTIGIDFSIFSSWINEAVQVHKNVELGNFKFNINIPGALFTKAEEEPETLWGKVYTYGRVSTYHDADSLTNTSEERKLYLEQNLIDVEGDSFVVPRSYMPIHNGKPMWGTGEYNIKVKIKESCQFANDSEKGKNWRQDYKQLREMQNRSGEVQEYFKTLWSQYGNNIVKTTYKSAMSTAGTDAVNEIVKSSKFLSGASSAAGSVSATSDATASGQPPM